MSKSSTSKPWWSSLGFGPREAEPDTDYADMGTAFGLDASMHSHPAQDDAAAAPETGRTGAKASRGGKER